MTPEERELLTRSIKLSEENNKMLRSIRRSARFSSILRAIYWLIILGAAFGAYYFIQPYITAVVESYNTIQKGVQNVSSLNTKLLTMPELPSLPSWLTGSTTPKK